MQNLASEVKWYEQNFNEDYLRIYAHRNEENAGKELEEIVSFIDVMPGQSVLDLCCGQGRHSRWLAKKGLRVTGVDLSEVLLREGISDSLGLKIQYMRADARDLPFYQEMDIVVNLAASFGYFSDDKENEKVIAQASKALKTGGYFIFDYLNPGYLQWHLEPFSQTKQNGLEILQYRSLTDGYVTKKIVIKDGEKQREYEERIMLYDTFTLVGMFHRNQLVVEHLFGDYEANEYNEFLSPRIIMICRKVNS